jgi:hypothetical protein
VVLNASETRFKRIDRCRCAEKSGQASTREPTDAHLRSDGPLNPSLMNGKRVYFYVFDPSGSFCADVMIVDPTAPTCSGLAATKLSKKSEILKREEHALNGAPWFLYR